MAVERRFIQLQGFAKLEYKGTYMEITLITGRGDLLYKDSPFKLDYTAIRDKQVFKLENGVMAVEFINVLFDFDDTLFDLLKSRTQVNDRTWSTIGEEEMFTRVLSKDPNARPRPIKFDSANMLISQRRDENYKLISIDLVKDRDESEQWTTQTN